jgi:hypothetical protein
MGRIPGFSDAIFPTASIPNLNLIANLGLVLFLFLVGLEVDMRYLISNWRSAVSVGLAGMALPFGLGCAIAWGLYQEFSDEPDTVHIDFGVYLLFIGVAMAITVSTVGFCLFCLALIFVRLSLSSAVFLQSLSYYLHPLVSSSCQPELATTLWAGSCSHFVLLLSTQEVASQRFMSS